MQQTWVSICSYYPFALFLVVLFKFRYFFFLLIYVNSLGVVTAFCSPGGLCPSSIVKQFLVGSVDRIIFL